MAEPPYTVVVVADLGGRRGPGARRLLRVDRDNLPAILAGLGTTIEVPEGGARACLEIAALDDFRPESLARRLPGLAQPLPQRTPVPPTAGSGARGAVPAPLPTGPGLLEAILREREGAPAMDPGLADFVRRAAEPALVRSSDAGVALQAEWLSTILHHPPFQALEAAWRALHGLVALAETSPDLQIRVLDAERSEAAPLLGDALGTAGAPVPAAIIAAYRFGPAGDDLAALAELAMVAAHHRVALIADALPTLLGVADARALGDPDVRRQLAIAPRSDGWQALREGPLGGNLALCLPRVLLRLPYGRDGEDSGGVPGEEQVTDHEHFLWGSAALAFGGVLVRALAAGTSDLGAHADLDGLPLFVRRAGGVEEVLPCAEVVMSDATIRAVVERGFTVLASVRDADRASFWGIGTVAGTPLPGIG